MKLNPSTLIIATLILTTSTFGGSVGVTARILQPMKVNSSREVITTDGGTFIGGSLSYKYNNYSAVASFLAGTYKDEARWSEYGKEKEEDFKGNFKQTELGIVREFVQSSKSMINSVALYLGYRRFDSKSLQEYPPMEYKFHEVDASVDSALMGIAFQVLSPIESNNLLQGLGMYMVFYGGVGLNSKASLEGIEAPGKTQMQMELGFQKMITKRSVIRVGYLYENISELFNAHMVSASANIGF